MVNPISTYFKSLSSPKPVRATAPKSLSAHNSRVGVRLLTIKRRISAPPTLSIRLYRAQ